jgi:DNA replication ATP-dependent helicase Dna2
VSELNVTLSEDSSGQLDPKMMGQWATQRVINLVALEDEKEAVEGLYRLMKQIAQLATQEEGIEFATVFSRLAYLKSLHQLSGRLIYAAQHFRRAVEQNQWAHLNDAKALGVWVNVHFIDELWGVKQSTSVPILAQELHEILPEKRKVASFRPFLRGMLLGQADDEFCLRFLEEAHALEEQIVQFHEADRNEGFTQNIQDLIRQGDFPVYVHLWNVEMDEAGVLHPMAFIFEPDYLIDVTAIASCFDFSGVNFYTYILNKLVPSEKSIHLLKGNVANHILDRLVHQSGLSFQSIFKETFHQFPLDYALLTEEEMGEVYKDAQLFYEVLQKVVGEDLVRLGIETEQCAVEPSFYSPEFGIQGRLDLLHMSPDRQLNHIVELKSGKIFRPNKYGLNQSHYIQTLLYDLLVHQAMPTSSETLAYILYCKDYERPLRHAPVARASQMEALQIRNKIILFERYCARLQTAPDDAALFKNLTARKLRLKGFLATDLARFELAFKNLDAVEQAYYSGFFGFLVREHHLAKVGLEGSERRAGMSAIWRDALRQKEERFSLMRDLRLERCRLDRDHTLHFSRGSETDPLANFRVGDIVILYGQKQLSQPTKGEIHKGTLVYMDDQMVVLRLRNAQPEETAFEPGSKWCLEHDMFDSSYRSSFQNLFHWAELPPSQRALFLGRRAPEIQSSEAIQLPKGLSEEQGEILQKMHQAKEYFLLWGPPGTGKTSVMLKSYVQKLVEEGQERIMLLAYTNKAVDEICHTLERIKAVHPFQYCRIGSRFSTDEAYKDRLLQEQAQKVNDREGLKNLLNQQQIYVATVASYLGKRDLLKILSFDQVIIDEASQLLEPMMGSMMADFPKMVLIGDHRQLPAVVQQDRKWTQVRHKGLTELGLTDLANSWFERLYRRASAQKWTHAYAQLSYQGRMHQEIMRFPAQTFYGGHLFVLPPELNPSQVQTETIQWSQEAAGNQYVVGQHRMQFLASEVTEEEQLQKTNQDEAQKVVRLIRDYHRLYTENDKEWTDQTVGVITPFRAQIAQIRKLLWQVQEEWASKVTIDTVERFQGGARDIIILSLCVNSVHQWPSVLSPNDEGVDRKLNVALTRARSFFVLIGHEDTIKQQPLYQQLLQECHPILERSDV